MYYHVMQSPIGDLLLAGDEQALQAVYFQGGPRPIRPERDWQADARPFREAVRQLQAYFSGKLQKFDLPLAPEGTDFQMKVWRALQSIPYGETWSYGELARRIRKPTASRAVGAANGQNPIPVIIPCHRVIGANGLLTGFGGGLPIKRKLLELESSERTLF
jgi:methylated-DNA-[protein]-cysteine S-methyltransferase